ncbi:MAG: sulfite exporter TauE/SafE family protein [Deltaproteobacteria bacterium]|nr:sulfite exporter TauE/SafE family protein [Candidatus Zymogenaceae bacterium]
MCITSFWDYALLAAIIFLASGVQGLSGFGFALVSMSLLPLFFPITFVTPLVALEAALVTFYVFLTLRSHFDIKKLSPLLIGALFGIPLGVFGLIHLNEVVIIRTFAVCLFLYALYSLVGREPSFSLSKTWGYVFGFVSGCLGGAYNTSGPPAIIYTSLQDWDKNEATITLQSYFMVTALLIIVMHSINGLITVEVLKCVGIVIPFSLVGVFIGTYFFSRIKQETFKRIVFTLLMIVSAALFFH